MENSVKILASNAKEAAIILAAKSSDAKNKALLRMADALYEKREEIIRANEQDVENAKKDNIAPPLLKRLIFKEDKLIDVIKGIRDLAALPDPIGQTTYQSELDKGLELYRVTCPIGVIGIIFEARPDALVQISALCLKSANSVLLKGGMEASLTNQALAKIIEEASVNEDIPKGWISLLLTRTDVSELLKMEDEVNLIIPRGSNQFVQMIMNNTKIPVLGHADGVCHTYIDKSADSEMAYKILLDAKTQYVSACNTTETVLIHIDVSNQILPRLNEIFKENNIEIFGCEKTCKILGCKEVLNWHHEYLDYQISIKIVDSMEDAIVHINKYGSGHTEAIITSDEDSARKFMSLVDSGNVFWNCSTRFSDGFRYGFGAEVGISTSKIHARGPVGLEGLVTYKYKLFGCGQIVGDYSSGKAIFLHNKLSNECKFDR